MKRFIQIISLVLVFSMAILSLSSCGVTKEERLAEAIAKLVDAKKGDYTASVKMSISAQGMEMTVPMEIEAKADISDEANPIVYTKMSMSISGQSMDMVSFYKGGYLYSAQTVQGVTQKYKVSMSYDEMTTEESFDITDLIAAKKDSLTSGVEIIENYDRTLTVKLTFSKSDFAEELEKVVAELSSSLGLDSDINVNDTVVELTIDADNNITSIKTSMDMDMNVMGETASAKYDMEFTYNVVGEGFTIELPTDLDKYVEMPDFN
jgi:hypothetical protein